MGQAMCFHIHLNCCKSLLPWIVPSLSSIAFQLHEPCQNTQGSTNTHSSSSQREAEDKKHGQANGGWKEKYNYAQLRREQEHP